jgi:hypothetical protein
LFWQRCFITILLCAFLSRFIHLASDLDRSWAPEASFYINSSLEEFL